MFKKNFNGQVILCLKENKYRTDIDLLFSTILYFFMPISKYEY